MTYKGSKTVEKYRDFWFFSYLCNGINFRDMLFLRYGNIVDGEICFVRSKTSHTSNHIREIRAVLTPEMRDIIKRWETRTKGIPILSFSSMPKTRRTNLSFPILSDG